MKLVDAKTWAERTFDPESMPPEVTLQRWLRTGAVPARKVGGRWFVDEHAWLAGGDDLMLRVLEAG